MSKVSKPLTFGVVGIIVLDIEIALVLTDTESPRGESVYKYFVWAHLGLSKNR